VGFFKFLKKGDRTEGRDLDSAMSLEDIPPAPRPFDMKAPQQPMTDMPDFSKMAESGEDIEIPSMPDMMDIEKTIMPTTGAPDKSKAEKFFEDIPFPGVSKSNFSSQPNFQKPIEASRPSFEAPRTFTEAPVPQPKFEAPKPFEAPPVEEPKPEIKPVPAPPKIEPAIVIARPKAPEKIEFDDIKAPKEEEDNGEFKYLQERVSVDFAKPLFLNLDQCETIVDASNDMRKDIASYEESYQKLCEGLATSDKQFQKWRVALEDTLKKLIDIDKGLFKAG
jgi:hypothetical protein